MQLTPHQTEALQKLQAFSTTEGTRCFVLRGYAGTGKTTLVGSYVKWLKENDFEVVLLATTGRAAKVLANKTGAEAATIHACIYQFDEMGGLGEEASDSSNTGNQLTLQFGIREQPSFEKSVVYIVDEASMIANTPSDRGQLATFGSGHLLVDFIEYTRGQRMVFVGDPCQLPPVSADPFSPALSPRYMRDQYLVNVNYAELSEIIRQDAQSEILNLAGRFRSNIINEQYIKWPKIAPPRGRSAHLYKNENGLIEEYLKYLKRKNYDEALMITNANRHCRRLNHRLRMTLFNDKNVQPGELLMVVQNNHLVPLSNGDQIVLESVKPYDQKAGFSFLKVKVRNLSNNLSYDTLMLRELLYNDYAGLQPEESQRLLIDFDQRARKNGLKRKSKVYQDAMRSDPYLNALRAKFGYVITCHKSQGGEWDHVFLNIQKSLYVQQGNALYRWYYTALTRASKFLHLNDGFWIQDFAKRQPAANADFFKKRNNKR
jgi:ATP-dependent exoDNAse (exonuclease V) alpha subunit